jgi:hypothetical protein
VETAFEADLARPHLEPPEPTDGCADGVPQTGLYLREDIEIECNRTLISFVKSQLKTNTFEAAFN